MTISIFTPLFLCESFPCTQRMQGRPSKYFFLFPMLILALASLVLEKQKQIKSWYFLCLHLRQESFGCLQLTQDVSVIYRWKQRELHSFFCKSLARDVCPLIRSPAFNLQLKMGGGKSFRRRIKLIKVWSCSNAHIVFQSKWSANMLHPLFVAHWSPSDGATQSAGFGVVVTAVSGKGKQ